MTVLDLKIIDSLVLKWRISQERLCGRAGTSGAIVRENTG
jgi:hypothetical protein